MKYPIIRVFENNRIIIYKRLFDLKHSPGSERYFETDILGKSTGKQFRSITQVNKHVLKPNS